MYDIISYILSRELNKTTEDLRKKMEESTKIVENNKSMAKELTSLNAKLTNIDDMISFGYYKDHFGISLIFVDGLILNP